MAGGSAVSSGVIETWKIALETMNKLVSGEPQAVQNGAALLGLSAWHLYPDMSIHKSVPIEIKMEDPCVTRGGTLSLGVSRRLISSNEEGGVRWSLSLSHLRHYGRPVDVTRGLEADARLTWSQFKLVVFAALLERWRLQGTPDETIARFFASLPQHSDAHPYLSKSDVNMFKFLKDGAAAYIKRDIEAESLDHKLIQLGRRRAHQFIPGRQTIDAQWNPLIYLFDSTRSFSALKDTESAISYLRYAARRLSHKNTPPDAFIIRQKLLDPERSDVSSCRLPSSLCSKCMVVTALPPELQEGTGNATHHRWLPADAQDINVPRNETRTFDVTEKFKCSENGPQITAPHGPAKYIYRPILTVSETTALYSRVLSEDSGSVNYIPTIEDWNWCLDHGLVLPDVVLKALNHGSTIGQSSIEPTLRTIAAVASVYDNIPNATIHTGVLMRSLKDTSWGMNVVSGNLEHEDMVSMISYLETGIHDINPRCCKLFPMVEKNSLRFQLIQNPYETLLPEQTPHFQRILGNIGKPGLNFLLPTQRPIMREIDAGSWRIDSYGNFDGTTSHSFENTSMHLSFTDYRIPHFDGLRGAYDSQIYFLESVISVQDNGEWVADVDPSPLIKCERYEEVSTDDDNVTEHIFDEGDSTDTDGGDEKEEGDDDDDDEDNEEPFEPVHRLQHQGPCQHKMNSTPGQNITAMDTWNELFDVPKGMFVVRTGGNWVPKLAATLVAYQSMAQVSSTFAVTVCPPQVCWVCVQKKAHHQAFIF
ncbi:hypothetical protein COCCADRAFT_31514 [Bipolaris zeicola 26-R-13]|uniref:Uncharacterized protein n=1 Tax=Cochliobolus carbonum (strain 26-R-13) TaxID=930089 RepID=W6XVL2_COCC2|nr:uncharacterized protein COCCADRAFT_31514 [Bipolaris zeicola 26-R-13]EUC26799.1 hypothetical protein COCCADRAFT_31514 [Bipolaris zeicola 26-R-13]